jgi:hypothetical protein
MPVIVECNVVNGKYPHIDPPRQPQPTVPSFKWLQHRGELKPALNTMFKVWKTR